MTKTVFSILILFCLTIALQAQVISTKYMLKYNDTTARFDMYLVITGGSATTIPQRTQLNAQITYVVPKGSNINITNRYQPITPSTLQPINWNMFALRNHPQYDFISFSPELSPTSRYEILNTGDTIKLFSLAVTPVPCKSEVRLYVNGSDPSSTDPGMNQTDASNGFTLGSVLQIYTGNVITVPPVTLPVTALQSNNVCPNRTIQATPTTGGTWRSLNPNVATISSAGLITGVNPGSTQFLFRESGTGCSSLPTEPLTVYERPAVSLTGPNTICVGQTTNVTPSSGGFWTSDNSPVAPISNNGLITGISAGKTQFRFTFTPTGCTSLPTDTVTVLKPQVALTGPTSICVGQTTSVTPVSGGTWSSNNPAIASISNTGQITGLSQGAVTYEYTSIFGCRSVTSPVTVNPLPVVFVANDSINQLQTVALSPSTGGTWISNNPDIIGIIGSTAKGLKLGNGSVYFTELATGCRSVNKEIKVINPITTVVGYAFRDINGNNIFDAATESPLPNCAITIPGINMTFYTDKTGYYNIKVPPGTYTSTFMVPYGQWTTNTKNRTINATGSTVYVFVGFTPISQVPSALVTINSPSLLCNTSVGFKVSAFNNSSQILSGYLVLNVDSKTSVSSTIPFPVGSDDNQLIWAINNLMPGHTFTPEMVLDIPLPSQGNNNLRYQAYILGQNSDTLSRFEYSDIISCMVTNGKAISWPDREGVQNFTLRNESLDYMIQFENPSSSRVQKVTIKNLLDSNIDTSSIIVKESSHPVNVFREGNLLNFEFNEINLNGARADTKNGYISFQAKFKPSLPDGTVITNSANINFDNLQTINTNSTINTIVSALPSGPLPVRWQSFDVEKQNEEVWLTWDVINEINTDTYEIQWSGNGLNFLTIGKVKALLSLGESQNYTFIHTNPYQGNNFYRIRQIDFDGQYTFSSIRSISFIPTTDLLSVKIYPNPTNHLIHINGLSNTHESLHITIYDATGLVVKKQMLNINKSEFIQIDDLAAGTYLLRLQSKDQSRMAKFVKM